MGIAKRRAAGAAVPVDPRTSHFLSFLACRVAFSNVWRGPLSCSLVAVDTTKIPLLRGSPKILQTKRTNKTLEEAIVTIGNNDRKFACIYIYTAFIIIAL